METDFRLGESLNQKFDYINLVRIFIICKQRDQNLSLIDCLSFEFDLSPINILFPKLQGLIRKIQEYLMTFFYRDIGTLPADS